MNPDDTEPTQILIVEDEEKLAEMYALWLSESYEVDTANSGREALEAVGPDTDLVFLDRRLGDMTGGEVMDEITARGIDCHIVMVTRFKPDIEIIQRELDAYLQKPVDSDRLHDVAETIRDRSTYNDAVREWVGVQNKIEVLEDVMSEDRQDDSAFLQELYDYAETKEEEMDEKAEDLTHLLVHPEELK